MNGTGVAAALLSVALLSGCASTGYGSNETIGTLGGAVAGGALGSMVGGGSGRVAAIAGGALLGGFLGNQVGARLDEGDRLRAERAQLEALEYGRSARWGSPAGRAYGEVSVGPSYSYGYGGQCREYTSTVYVDGRPEIARGLACRQSDGTWRPS